MRVIPLIKTYDMLFSGSSTDNFHGFVMTLLIVGGSIFDVVHRIQSLKRKNILALNPPRGPAHFRR